MTDREQIRRNERARLVMRVRTAQVLQHRGHDGLAGSPDETCVRCNADRAFDALLAELEQAERERDEAQNDANNNALASQRAEAQLAKVPALVEALESVVAHDDHASSDADCLIYAIEAAREALAAWEKP